MVGTCIRLFRYVIDQYPGEFCENLRKHLESTLQVLPHDSELVAGSRTDSLLQLYGSAVFPDDLVHLLNVCISKLQHKCVANEDMQSIRSTASQIICRSLLLVDEKPVQTRFFTFAECVFALFRMDFLNLRPDVWMTLHSVRPQRENSKRMSRVSRFFESPSMKSDIRQAALCLRLTSHATPVCSQGGKEGRLPLVVRLAQGEVQRKASADLQSIVPLLHCDPDIHLTQTFLALMTTAGHLIMRFSIYLQYPAKIWTLLKKYNPHSFRSAALDFLQELANQLDAGYSLPLQQEALSKVSNTEQVAFLAQPHIQHEVDQILERAVNNLDVERKHWQDKRSETGAGKVASLSRCSRNSLIRKYRVMRAHAKHRKSKHYKQAQKDRFANARSIAVEGNPDWLPRPRGALHWEKGISAACRSQTTHEGKSEALNEYMDLHRDELRETACQRREAAKKVLQLGKRSFFPLSTAEWLEWIGDNEDFYQETLRTATETRRDYSRRPTLV